MKKIPFLITRDPKPKTLIQLLSNTLKVGDLISNGDYLYRVEEILGDGYNAKLFNILIKKSIGYTSLKGYKLVTTIKYPPNRYTPFKICIEKYSDSSFKFKMRKYIRNICWWLFLMPWRI